MTTPQPQRVTCPNCSKAYRWQEGLIGQHVTCKQCDIAFAVPPSPGVGMPIQPEPLAEDGTYELDFDAIHETPAPEFVVPAAASAARPANTNCPSCNIALREGAVLCMNCGYNLAEGKTTQTAIEQTPPDEPADDDPYAGMSKLQKRELQRIAAAQAHHDWSDYKLPTLVVCVGLGMVLVNNLLLGPMSDAVQSAFGGTYEVILGLTIETIYSTLVSSALLFTGLLILVKLFGAAFGTLTSVLLRVLGITLVAQEADFMVIVILDILMSTGGLGG